MDSTSQHISFRALVEALRCGKATCRCMRPIKKGKKAKVHCPACNKKEVSLWLGRWRDPGGFSVMCSAGCTATDVMAALCNRGLVHPTSDLSGVRDRRAVRLDENDTSAPSLSVDGLRESSDRAKANARNAFRSTGPKTEAGKGRSSLNARKHGLLARETLLEGEDATALSELDERLRMALDPQGELESLLVDMIVSSMWRLRRLYRIEAGVLAWHQRWAEKERAEDWDSPTRIKRTVDEEGHGAAVARLDETGARQAEEVVTLGLAFIKDAAQPDALSKLSRYETTIERGLYRALHELQRLQAARTGQAIAPPLAVDVNLSSTG